MTADEAVKFMEDPSKTLTVSANEYFVVQSFIQTITANRLNEILGFYVALGCSEPFTLYNRMQMIIEEGDTLGNRIKCERVKPKVKRKRVRK
jgi:hypothetical protein